MKIVLTGGGTAGHVMPNVALLPKLYGNDVYYVGTSSMEKDILAPFVANGTVKEYCTVSACKFKRKLSFDNLLIPFNLLKSVSQCKKVLKSISPDVIFSKGGYVGLPVVIAGKKLGIKTVVHESDLTLGLANKLSFLFADEKLSAFPIKNAKQVGAILRSNNGDTTKGLKTMGFDGTKPIVLVMGGSLGAKAISDAVQRQFDIFNAKFDVFVITGKGKRLQNNKIHQCEFADNIYDLYSASDVCVTRGGANALCELTKAKLPFVSIPLTKGSRGEQRKNAEYFYKLGVGVMLEESKLDNLYNKVNFVYGCKSAFQKNAEKVDIDGTDKVAEIILSR